LNHKLDDHVCYYIGVTSRSLVLVVLLVDGQSYLTKYWPTVCLICMGN
jgi:hypothetical protein